MEHQSPASVAPRSRFLVFLENVLYLLGAVALAIIIQTFIVRPFIVNGSSMDPIIKNGQYMLVDELSYRFGDVARGDVIVFKAPPEPTKYYIKRVIGLPGDTVTIKSGTVTITNDTHPNGFTLDEPYLTHTSSDSLTTTVPADQYFVMGDNRSGSYDSRGWGTLPETNIRGRALLRLLPLTTIKYLPGKETYDETN